MEHLTGFEPVCAGVAVQPLAAWVQVQMAGMAGFEPANVGVKGRCLTAWRHPNMVQRAGVEPARPFGHKILSLACLPNSSIPAYGTPDGI